MKPFNELTRLGRIRRIRQLATVALTRYGVGEAHFHLVRQAGNTLFRVRTSNLPRPEAPGGLFEEGQYLLRVHEPGYQESEALELELAWLTAMRGVSNALVDWSEREGDAAVIALIDSMPVGAAWYRFYTDDNCIRGYIDETIPAIAIAVHKNYRHQGIGEKMIEWLIDYASKHNIQKLSLMVSKDNHAIRLYRKCGFLEYADKGDSLLMLRKVETR